MKQFEYSVIDVSREIVFGIRGSSDTPFDLERKIIWLKWRVTESWNPSVIELCIDWDNHVRNMAREAVKLAESREV